jgi:hypothetical protein
LSLPTYSLQAAEARTMRCGIRLRSKVVFDILFSYGMREEKETIP